MSICVIGPSQSGKTLLLKRLKNNNFDLSKNYFNLPETVQTNGTNILRLSKSNNQQDIVLQEIGGEMIQLSLDFIPSSTKIIFVIDSSDISKFSLIFKNLFQILTNHQSQNKPFLIVLNKTDLYSSIKADDIINNFLFLNDIKKEFVSNSIQIFKTSCLTGKGLKEVYDWVLNF